MNSRQIVKTEDGSSTLYNSILKEHYHSTFGALQESRHVFIKAGLDHLQTKREPINILEVGFGTGLNALLALLWASENKRTINYTGVEAFPIAIEMAKKLNYPVLLNTGRGYFLKMHSSVAGEVALSECFNFNLKIGLIQEIELEDSFYDLVFFDAFSPDTQPELWTQQVFSKLNKAMKMNGYLTTYSTKGIVKRALKSAGFSIEKLPGPPGKREILRATKVTGLT
jgi:tRNA U34 5-methylaminomethyl-2-thiouridine-forming methyltransferase MnmC